MPSHKAHRAVLISVSLALSQTRAYIARPMHTGLVYHTVYQLSLVLIAPTHGGMARVS